MDFLLFYLYYIEVADAALEITGSLQREVKRLYKLELLFFGYPSFLAFEVVL